MIADRLIKIATGVGGCMLVTFGARLEWEFGVGLFLLLMFIDWLPHGPVHLENRKHKLSLPLRLAPSIRPSRWIT